MELHVDEPTLHAVRDAVINVGITEHYHMISWVTTLAIYIGGS